MTVNLRILSLLLIFALTACADRESAESLYELALTQSDEDDYPSALRNAERALELTPDSPENQPLRRRILSLSGRINSELGNRSQAIRDLKESTALNDDTASLMVDLQLLTNLYLESDSVLAAHEVMDRLLSLPSPNGLANDYTTMIRTRMLLCENKPDSALSLLRPHLSALDETCYANLILDYTFKAFEAKEMTDSHSTTQCHLQLLMMTFAKPTHTPFYFPKSSSRGLPKNRLPALHADILKFLIMNGNRKHRK